MLRWSRGHRGVFAERVFATPLRLVPVAPNGQLAFACYQYEGERFQLGAVNVLSLRDRRISWIAGLVDPQLFRHFSVPMNFLGRTDESGVDGVSPRVTAPTPT